MDESFDVIGYWAITSCSWLFILSCPLLLFPRLLVFLSNQESLTPQHHHGHHANEKVDLSPLEGFLVQQLGWGCVALAVILACIVASPTPTPSFPPLDHLNRPILPADPVRSLRLAITLVVSSLLGWLSLVTWNHRHLTPGLSSFLGIGNGLVAVYGFWVGVFGFGGRISRKTGADKRTSAFPLKNVNAASVQKQEWKRSQHAQQ